MEEFEDYEIEYLQDQAILEEERRIRMEAEWQEAEYEKEKQLPAKIIFKENVKKVEIDQK